LSERPLPGSPINCFRVTAVLPGPPHKYVDTLWSWGHPQWSDFDPNIKLWRIVEELEPDLRIIYQCQALPWPVYSRDFCMSGVKYADDQAGCFMMVFRSVTHADAPEDSNFVRGTVLHASYVFERQEDGTTLFTRFLQVEPNGLLPAAVVNSQSSNLLEIPPKLRNLSVS